MGEELLDVALRSLVVSGSAVAISTLLGVPLGVWLGLARFPLRRLFKAVIHAGMAMPPVVVGLVLYMVLSRSGPLGSWGWLFSVQAMIVAQVVLSLPFVLGISLQAVEALPEDLSDQLRSLGATAAQIRWTLAREAVPGILLAIAAALGRSISEVGAVLLVGGNIEGKTRVLTTAIVLETSKGNFQLAVSMGVVLLLVALATNYWMLRWTRAAA
jgi:tungstate transport system permease protein